MLKAYMETNLTNNFIWLSKLFVSTFIFLAQNFDNNFQLYVNYQSFNNLTIKNQYLIFPIGELLD